MPVVRSAFPSDGSDDDDYFMLAAEGPDGRPNQDEIWVQIPDSHNGPVPIPYVCHRCSHSFPSDFSFDLANPPLQASSTSRCKRCGAIAAFPKIFHVQNTAGEVLCTISSEGPSAHDLSDLNLDAIKRLGEIAQRVIDGDADPQELIDHLDTGPKFMRRLRNRFPKTTEGRIALASLCVVIVQTVVPMLESDNPPPPPQIQIIVNDVAEQSTSGK